MAGDFCCLLAVHPEPAFVGSAVGHRSRNSQLDFGAGPDFAPQIELGADLKGALAHTGQSPVSRPPVAQVLLVDALAVVANAQAKLARPIGDFRLDASRLCVTECVAQRFAGNAVNVVADNRMQVA